MFLGSALEHRHIMTWTERTNPVFTRVWPRWTWRGVTKSWVVLVYRWTEIWVYRL